MAGVQEIPAVVRDLSESEVMQLALIENLQREDLNPLEEAGGYRALMDEYGFTQEDVARTVGRSRPAVANALRLLALPEDLREMVGEGVLSAGHARTLLSFPDEESMRRAAKLAIEQELSVRQLEKLAQSAREQKEEQEKQNPSAAGCRTTTRWSSRCMSIWAAASPSRETRKKARCRLSSTARRISRSCSVCSTTGNTKHAGGFPPVSAFSVPAGHKSRGSPPRAARREKTAFFQITQRR